jgi:hypothetical protein
MAKAQDKAIQDITDLDELEGIIKRCDICHVGMVDGNRPYVLAFNFGYENQTIWLHAAKEGRKLDVLKRNNNVCVEFDTDHKLFARHEQVACSWRWAYRSVIVEGEAIFVEDYDEKVKGLNIFMKNYSDREFKYSKPAVDNIRIIKIPVASITGRSFEYYNNK